MGVNCLVNPRGVMRKADLTESGTSGGVNPSIRQFHPSPPGAATPCIRAEAPPRAASRGRRSEASRTR